MRSAIATAAALVFTVLASAARGDFLFSATLDAGQEVGGSTSTATGFATLTLNDAMTELFYSVTLSGIDMDGAQTPGTALDNMVNFHIHNAAPGVNGPVVLGMVSPAQDTAAPVYVQNPVAGTASGTWTAADPSSSTLASMIPALFAGNLYFNVHTTDHTAGAIRGQIVAIPEPSSWSLLAVTALLLAFLRRKRA